MSDTPSRPPEVAGEKQIDANFRNGTVTAVGIVLGFSLGFLSHWAANPIAWSKVDIMAALPLVAGIVLQVKALADLLSTASLQPRNYERAKRIFILGLLLVAGGVAAAILLDILGLGPRTLATGAR